MFILLMFALVVSRILIINSIMLVSIKIQFLGRWGQKVNRSIRHITINNIKMLVFVVECSERL
jgi:hypothetical protein